MHFCAVCSRAMRRVCLSGVVVFRCACGREEKGGPDDARIGGRSVGVSSTGDTFHTLIRNAPFDRTNKVVKRDCVTCGLDYMTQLRLGTAEIVIYRCKCGRQEDAGGVASVPGVMPPVVSGPGLAETKYPEIPLPEPEPEPPERAARGGPKKGEPAGSAGSPSSSRAGRGPATGP
ncbi:MAG TPA: hypothetical protein VNI01_10020 [Elusimicrobiota bacterium]|jgi:hypothetical protein|nr:hypothetical protein [Elusimicrobiota bacterium]